MVGADRPAHPAALALDLLGAADLLLADGVGMFGGWVIGYFILNLTSQQYWTSVWRAG